METELRFPGFKRVYKDSFFRYPNELESYWYLLSGSEQKLLDFILRRTYGFQKVEDHISLSQFVNGVGKKGKGPGVSRAQVQRSITGLESKGFIRTERHGYQTRLIKLVLRDEEVAEPVSEESAASGQVAYLISLFRNVAPHLVNGYLVSKAQIHAMERLIQHFGVPEIESLITGVGESFGKQYAPTITSPVQLEKKLPQLIAYFKRQQNEKDNGFKISF